MKKPRKYDFCRDVSIVSLIIYNIVAVASVGRNCNWKSLPRANLNSRERNTGNYFRLNGSACPTPSGNIVLRVSTRFFDGVLSGNGSPKEGGVGEKKKKHIVSSPENCTGKTVSKGRAETERIEYNTSAPGFTIIFI